MGKINRSPFLVMECDNEAMGEIFVKKGWFDADAAKQRLVQQVKSTISADIDSIDELFLAMYAYELATSTAISAMRTNIKKGRFTTAYYLAMWKPKLEDYLQQRLSLRRR